MPVGTDARPAVAAAGHIGEAFGLGIGTLRRQQFYAADLARLMQLACLFHVELLRLQIRGRKQTVTVNIERCVTILTRHPFLVMHILLHSDVVLRMQLGLPRTVGRVGRFVGRFQQSTQRTL